MHRIAGEYGEGGCGVLIDSGSSEPYLVLNLETYYKTNRIGGSHCDFVYILSKDDRFEVYLVELKEIKEISKENIRSSFQGKFPQTLQVLGNRLLQPLGLKPNKVRYYGVIAVPGDKLDKIGSLIRRDKTLLGGLRRLNGAWITPCGEHVMKRMVPLK